MTARERKTWVPPPLVALAAAVIQHKLAGEGRVGRVRTVVAAVLAVGSLGLDLGSMRNFARRHTTVDPLDPSRASALVTDGPNRLTRNPMYVGMAGLLTSHALARPGLLALLPVGLFVAVIDRVQIRAEEAALRRKFGDEYEAYCRRTRRWL